MPIVVYPQEYHLDLSNECVQQAIQPSCVANLGHYTQTFQFFFHTMFIGTSGFYYFIPLSLILTIPGDHKGSAEQKLLALFS